MSPRAVATELWDDEWWGGLPDRQALIWLGVFGSLADDQGRLPDNPALARSRLFPYRDDVATDDVRASFDAFVEAGRLLRYTCDDKPLLQVVNWWKHQRPRWARRSKYPAPEGWADHVRAREGGQYIVRNWPGVADEGELEGSHEPPHERSHEPPHERSHEPPHEGSRPRRDLDLEEDEIRPRPREPSSVDAAAPTDTSEPKLAADFEEWWDRYGNKRERTPAERLYAHWREHGASADQLLTAADNYRADCHANSRIQKYPATFLAKAHPPWKDWLEAAPVVSAPAPKGALDRTFDALRETWAGLQEQQR